MKPMHPTLIGEPSEPGASDVIVHPWLSILDRLTPTTYPLSNRVPQRGPNKAPGVGEASDLAASAFQPKAWSTRNSRCLSAVLRLQVALSEAFNALVGTYGNPAGSGAGSGAGAPGATEKAFLPREGVEAWLIKINRSLGRGSEYRAAEAIMEPGPEGGLTLEGEVPVLDSVSVAVCLVVSS